VCLGVSGNVFVTGGAAALILSYPSGSVFCSFGNLTWKSVDTGGGATDPVVDAEYGLAIFGATVCPLPQ